MKLEDVRNKFIRSREIYDKSYIVAWKTPYELRIGKIEDKG